MSALTALHGVSGVSAVVSDQKITTEKEAPQPEKLMEATKMMKLSVTHTCKHLSLYNHGGNKDDEAFCDIPVNISLSTIMEATKMKKLSVTHTCKHLSLYNHGSKKDDEAFRDTHL